MGGRERIVAPGVLAWGHVREEPIGSKRRMVGCIVGMDDAISILPSVN
jgi:hypothetical protein